MSSSFRVTLVMMVMVMVMVTGTEHLIAPGEV